MHVLHLFSNWKWTGPAEPALNLCIALKKRGHRVSFICGRPPREGLESLRSKALGKGLEPINGYKLNKHFNVVDNLIDLLSLKKYLKAERPDIIHTHLPNDHFLAGITSREFSPHIPVVRTSYEGEGLRKGLWNKVLLKSLTAGLITISEKARGNDINGFGLPPDRVWKIEVGIDTQRFNPSRRLPNMGPLYGLQAGDIVVGIVARVQRHRRFDVFLEAFKKASREMPNLKAMIVGRGTNIIPIAKEPVKAMGLEERVIFPGYREGDEYVATLAAMDMKVFLVPGTDGSCRAVREAMAMGVPVIVAKRGMLPEMVTHGQTGLVVEDTAENLTSAILELVGDWSLRRKMGNNALQKAQRDFSLEKQAADVESVYQEVLEREKALSSAIPSTAMFSRE